MKKFKVRCWVTGRGRKAEWPVSQHEFLRNRNKLRYEGTWWRGGRRVSAGAGRAGAETVFEDNI